MTACVLMSPGCMTSTLRCLIMYVCEQCMIVLVHAKYCASTYCAAMQVLIYTHVVRQAGLCGSFSLYKDDHKHEQVTVVQPTNTNLMLVLVLVQVYRKLQTHNHKKYYY